MNTRFLIPRTADVILTFNGTNFHLAEKKGYRRLFFALLKRHQQDKLRILVGGSEEIPARIFIEFLHKVFGEQLKKRPVSIQSHGKVNGIASLLIVRHAGVNQAYRFDHRSLPIAKDREWADEAWHRFADA